MSWAEKKKAKQAAEAAEANDPEARKKRLEMEAITAIADKMMAFGVFSEFSLEPIARSADADRQSLADVYEDTYEQIIRKLRIDDAIGELLASNIMSKRSWLTVFARDRRVLGTWRPAVAELAPSHTGT